MARLTIDGRRGSGEIARSDYGAARSHTAAPALLARLRGYRKLRITDLSPDTGFHIRAHTEYWGHPTVAQHLVALWDACLQSWLQTERCFDLEKE